MVFVFLKITCSKHLARAVQDGRDVAPSEIESPDPQQRAFKREILPISRQRHEEL